MSLSSSFNPFEIRNRQQQQQQQHSPQQQEYYYHQNQYYQGIPDIPTDELTDEEVARLLFQKKQATRRWKCWNSTIVRRSMRISGVCCSIILGSIVILNILHIVVVPSWTMHNNNNNEEESLHRPHFVPTLLSVIDPTTGHSVYALNNTLYERMLHDPKTKFVSLEESKYYNNKRNNKHQQHYELPTLSLDKTTIRPIDDSITLSWTLGRDNRSSKKVLVTDDDVIALYCGGTEEEDTVTTKATTFESRNFLEAATIAQAKATSIKNGRSVDGNDITSWYISNFPILRQESCHFRLYLTDDLNNQFIHVASTNPFRIELANRNTNCNPLGLYQLFFYDDHSIYNRICRRQ